MITITQHVPIPDAPDDAEVTTTPIVATHDGKQFMSDNPSFVLWLASAFAGLAGAELVAQLKDKGLEVE